MQPKGFIREQTVSYIEAQLKEKNDEQQKVALQNLCKLCRNGYRLQNPYRFQTIITGLLYSPSAKVRRWSLNALAQIGNQANVEAVIEATIRGRSDPDILAAGVAALFSLDRDIERVNGLLKQRQLPLEGAMLLAAAQSVQQFQRDLASRPLNIDLASPVELRMATLLVGLDRAPPNLLHVTHLNAQMIGELNDHDDSTVAQYSIWATCENPALGLPHLKLDVRHIQDQPPNVRGWIYRLLVSNAQTASDHREYLDCGASDKSSEAREGLAFGIRQIFFDGMERVVFGWFPNEESEVIRNALIEHMAFNADHFPEYERAVIDTYDRAPPKSLTRARLEAACEGHPLYVKLKRISIINEQGSLLQASGGEIGGSVTNQTFNIKGSQIGSMSGTGNAIGGTVNVTNNGEAVAVSKAALARLLTLLDSEGVSAADKKDGIAIAKSVAEKPTKGGMEKLVGWMGAVKAGGAMATELMSDFSQICDLLQHAIPHLAG